MDILKRVFILGFLLLIISKAASAQDKILVLAGKIVSANSSAGLPYVDIKIPAMGISAVCNEDGEFALKFPASYVAQDSIVFSCIGYKTQLIKIDDALKSPKLIIALSESIEELKEVAIKPLTTKQLLDSIVHRNQTAFISPMKLNGYYREFVFTNAKCTEYSDALFEYYYNNDLKTKGQLKIAASRCEKAKSAWDSNEAYISSKINPDHMFHLAMLYDMISEYFSDAQIVDYKYDLQEDSDNKSLHVTIYPKSDFDKIYKVQFILAEDFTLISYKLEIPVELLKNVKEKSALGIHGKPTNFTVEVRYGTNGAGIYPVYFKIGKDVKIWGKFLGSVFDQITRQESEFVVTQIDTKNIVPFPKNEIYKKGNLCNNGAGINTEMLKSYNFIPPTKKDSLAISSINKDLPSNK